METVLTNIEILRIRLEKEGIKLSTRNRGGKIYATLSTKKSLYENGVPIGYDFYQTAMKTNARDLFPNNQLTSFGGTATYRLNP